MNPKLSTRFQGKINRDMEVHELYLELFLEVSREVNMRAVLKGNILLNQILPDTARSTKDIDFDILSEEDYNEIVVPLLTKFGETAIATGTADSYDIREIQTNRSGGIVIYNRGSSVYEADIALSPNGIFGATKYTFNGEYAYGSTIEKIMSDKTVTTLSKRRLRRAKDFYDLYIILTSSIVYDINKVYERILSQISYDQLEELLSSFPFSDEEVSGLTTAWNKLTVYNVLRNEEMQKPEIAALLNTVYRYYRNLRVVARRLK